MKFLFKLIFIPLITIVIIPLIFLAIMYKSVEIPVDDFDTTGTSVDLMGMVTEDFDAFLENHDHDSSVAINIAQADVNNLLLNQFRQMNTSYLDENADAEDQEYVLKEPMFGYQGTWIRFKDETIEIESGIHAFVSSFTFKTRLLITFVADIGTDEVVLKLDKLNIGNLPLAWLFGPVDWIVEKATGNSIEDLINEQLNGIATFDPQTREIKMNVNDMIDVALEDDPDTQVLVNSLLTFINENELIDINFLDGEFNSGLGLGKLWEEGFSPYVLPEILRLNSEADLQGILANQASSLILSTLSGSDGLFIDINQVTLNRIFDYFLRDQRLPSGAIQEQEIMPGYLMKIMMPYVVIVNSEFKVNIPLVIEKVGFEATHHFESIIRVDATTGVVDGDLVINLLSITAGNGDEPLFLDGEFLADILAMVGDTSEDGFIQDGAFVIKDFYSTLNTDTFSINDIAVVNASLRMYIDIIDLGLPIEDIAQVVEDVLGALDNPNYPPELNDSIDDVLANLLDPLADPADVEASISDLVDTIGELDPEDQAELYTDLLTALEGTDGFDYEGLFDLLP